MPYLRPTLTALQQQAYSDITSAELGGVTALLPRSILRVLSYALAGLSWGHYAFIDWVSRESVPYTATDEFLEGWAALKGVLREDATAATGSAICSGTPGATIPASTMLSRADGWAYVNAAQVVLDGTGIGTLALTAVTAGAGGNAGSGITLTLSSPITGIQSTGLSNAAFTGGADQETDDSLRTRMLQTYANPIQGGALADYVSWALDVPGVTRAWSAQSGGYGTVTVYAMLDASESAYNGFPQGSNGGASSETRITAATGDQLTIANALYPLRPATAVVYVAAPVATPINFTINNLGSSNTATVQAGIASALAGLFLRAGSPLGGSIYQSDIAEALAAVPGLSQYSIASPSLPITVGAGNLPIVGSITFNT